jgi:hypothetical protein
VPFFVGQIRRWTSTLLSLRKGMGFIVVSIRKFAYDENKNLIFIYDSNGEVDIYSEETLEEHTEEILEDN